MTQSTALIAEAPVPTQQSPSLGLRIATVVAVVLPFVGLIAGIIYLWGWGMGWAEIGMLTGMYLLTGLGITVGFHRLFTHRSFQTNRVVQAILGILGSMAVQGPLLRWVACHRHHHRHSDKSDDLHSPHHSGRGFWGLIKGLWHAQIGWLFRADPANLYHYVKDLRQSKLLRAISALFPLWALLGLALPALLGWIMLGGWLGLLLGLVWGGLARIFLVHHVTWSVNSVCHLWGRKTYECNDESRNNFIFGVLAMGEGWHNNHHAFPTSARHGLRWWQIDISYWLIQLLALCRMAWDVKRPNQTALLAGMQRTG